MTEANQVTGARSGIVPGAVVGSAFLKEAEAWMSAQGEILSVMEAVVADWVRRRREAIDALSRSLQKMCECRNPVDFVRTQQDWLCDTIQWAASDMRAIAGDTTNLTRKRTAQFERSVGSPDDDARPRRRGRLEAGGRQPIEHAAEEITVRRSSEGL